MERRKIPRTMSTQHPDNVTQPFFADGEVLSGDDEVHEAHYAFTKLGCEEQMWDFEGKEGDTFVVKKLLSENEQFFKEKKLGKDVFITVRVPNPSIERTEAKILLETLESIPRSYDAAHMATGEEVAPIFEVIMPMTASARDLNRVYHYYCDYVIGKQNQKLFGDEMTIAEWVGPSNPETINVIPLFEDRESMLGCADILEEYLVDKSVSDVRVFLARSDPAVNYGLVGAVLLNCIALSRLHEFGIRKNIALHPILGVGSAPFRGHARPGAVQHLLATYPSVATFTVQSSFKYDHPASDVISAITELNAHIPMQPCTVDEEKLLDIITRVTAQYQQDLEPLIPLIQSISPLIPRRRMRKMHIGLFGYSRQLNGNSLPRAIPFVASLYSLGIPPELLGLSALTMDDRAVLHDVYPSFEYDLAAAARYCDLGSPYLLSEAKNAIERCISVAPSEEYCRLVRRELTSETILRLAQLRGFLG